MSLYDDHKRYSEIEAKLAQELLYINTLDFTPTTVGVDIDTIYRSIINLNTIFGAVLAPGGANRMPRETYSDPYGGGLPPNMGRSWVWMVDITFLIRLVALGSDPDISTTTQHELNMRKLYDALRVFLVGNERLGGLVGKAEVISITTPEGLEINDVLFYLVTASVEVLDKS